MIWEYFSIFFPVNIVAPSRLRGPLLCPWTARIDIIDVGKYDLNIKKERMCCLRKKERVALRDQAIEECRKNDRKLEILTSCIIPPV